MNVLNVLKREESGTSFARACRREDRIPAIIYGNKKSNINVSIARTDVVKKVKEGNFKSKVLELELENKKIKVLVKDVQRHVVKDNIIHVDFLMLEEGSKVKVFVPFKTINGDLSPGLKKGGVVNLVMHNIELSLPSEKIPGGIEVDLTGLYLNQSVLLKNIKLPEGSRVVKADLNSTLLTIIPPSGLRAKMSSDEMNEESDETDE